MKSNVSFPPVIKNFSSHGSGLYELHQFAMIGENVIFENGVLVFHPENIEIGNNVYIGHRTILKGYYKNKMIIGNDTWIGQDCFFHSAGGIKIGKGVGIAPKVNLLTSQHRPGNAGDAVLFTPLDFKCIEIHDGSDIGINATILPGVIVGEGAIVAANALVNKSIPPFEIWGGVPAKKIKVRG